MLLNVNYLCCSTVDLKNISAKITSNWFRLYRFKKSSYSFSSNYMGKKFNNFYLFFNVFSKYIFFESLFVLNPLFWSSGHGGWSNWTLWSACEGSCDPAKQMRKRYCSNPVPINGRNCTGLEYEIQECNLPPCNSKTASYTIFNISFS